MPEKQKRELLRGWLGIMAHPIQTFKGIRELLGWGKKGDAVTKDAKEKDEPL